MSRARRPSTTHLPPLAAPPATLLDGLVARFPRVGEETWRSRFARGLVSDLDGRPLAAGEPYRAGLGVRYFREVEDEPEIAGDVRIVHADDRLVVADKPPFLPVVPAGRFVRRCLLAEVEEALGEGGLAPVHRLDRATSGLVVFARHPADRGAYAGLFAARRVEKVYDALARVPAEPQSRRLTVESRIVTGDPFFRMTEVEGEPNAVTEVQLLSWADGVGRFELRPVTGKKHQLRLHMARLGWPILGDRRYPALLPEAPDDPASPLRLVARRLAFHDPFSGEERVFESGFDVVALGTSGKRPD